MGDGLKEIVEFSGCFAAGTLVHTNKGLVPIEKIKVGDMVLSRHESGKGELAYKRVTQTFITENQPISAMLIGGPPYGLSIEEDTDEYENKEFIFTTANHPFWTFERQGRYEIDSSNGKWVSALDLVRGSPLLHHSGKFIDVLENRKLYQTIELNKAFYMVFPDYDAGIFLDVNDYKNSRLTVPNYLEDESLEVVNWDENEDPIPDEYLASVYNFEVEDFHTYFVGELGAWVHNTCNPWAEYEVAEYIGLKSMDKNG